MLEDVDTLFCCLYLLQVVWLTQVLCVLDFEDDCLTIYIAYLH